MLGQMGFSEACGNFLPRRHFSRCESQGNEASGTRSYYRSEAARQQVAHTLPPLGGGLTPKKKQPTAQRCPYKPVFIFRAANRRTFCLPTRSEHLEASGGQLRSFFSIFSCTSGGAGAGKGAVVTQPGAAIAVISPGELPGSVPGRMERRARQKKRLHLEMHFIYIFITKLQSSD